MKKIINIIIAIAVLFIPLTAFATTVTWVATSTDPGYINPNLVNGNYDFIKIPYLIATSTINPSIFNDIVGIMNQSPVFPLDVGGFINTDQYSGYKQAGITVLSASSTTFNTSVGDFAGVSIQPNSSIGIENVSLGYAALTVSTSTSGTVSIGSFSLSNYVGSGQAGTLTGNTAVGNFSLNSMLSGLNETAIGSAAMGSSTGATTNNVAVGTQTMLNDTGSNNTAVGAGALKLGTSNSADTAIGEISQNLNTGSNNTTVGTMSLQSAVSVNNDTFVGTQSGFLETAIGSADNTGVGTFVLNKNTTGTDNAVFGENAEFSNVSATSTTAFGFRAASGASNYFNQDSTSIGFDSGTNFASSSNDNTLVGFKSGFNISTGIENTVLGDWTTPDILTTGNQNILIGYNTKLPSATANGQLNIGNFIYGTGLTGTLSTVSSGLIGIGTTTPWATLSVTGNSDLGNSALAGYFTATTTTASIFPTASTTALTISKLYDSTGSLGSLNNCMTSNGSLAIWGSCSGGNNFFSNSGASTWLTTGTNLGIGTSTPWGILSVGIPTYNANTPMFAIGSTTSSGTSTPFIVSGNGNSYFGTSTTVATNALSVQNTNSNTNVALFYSDIGATRFTISNAGTITSAGSATVLGVSGVSATIFRTTGPSPATSPVLGTDIRFPNLSQMQFDTAGVEAFRIATSSGGVIGIGTTSPFADLSVQQLNPNGAFFAVASSTTGVNSTTTIMEIDSKGHEIWGGLSPVLSSCGTSPSFIGAANDVKMIVQVGSVSATGCTITFAQSYGSRPEINITNESPSLTNLMTYTVSTTQIVVTQTGLTGDILDISVGQTQ